MRGGVRRRRARHVDHHARVRPFLPRILTPSPEKRTLPLALWTFQGQFSVNVPAVLASVVLTTLPIVILYAVFRRQLLSGLTAGFSK